MSIKVVGVVGFALFMDYLIYGLVIPLTPHWAAPGDDGALALLFAGYAVGVLIGTPLFGYAAERFGYRWTMLCGVVLSALTVLLLGWAQPYWLLMLGRLIQGAAASASWIAGMSLIARHYPAKRAEMLGYAMMASTGGSLLGPTMGGALYEVGGYALPFVAAAALVALDAAARVVLLPRDAATAADTQQPDLRALLLDRAVLLAGLAVALAAVGWSIIEPLLPGHLGQGGLSPTAIGVIFTLGSLAYGMSSPLVGRLSDRLPIRKVMAGGTVAMALCLPLLGLFPGVVGAALALGLVSVAYAFMLNPTSAELGNAVDRRGMSCYGAVYAVYNVAYAIGQIGATGFAAAAASMLGFNAVMLAVAAVMLAFAPLLLLGAAAPPLQPASERSPSA